MRYKRCYPQRLTGPPSPNTLQIRTMHETPRILIAGDKGHIAETEMIIGLKNIGLDICAAYNSDSKEIPKLLAAGVPTKTLNLKRGLDIPKIRLIRKWLKSDGFNILHGLSNRATTNFLWASYGQSNKVIAYRGATGHVSRLDPTCYLKWLNPRLDKIICVSKAVSRDLSKNGVSPKKLTTIYKGHDLSWYAGSHTLTADRQIRNVFKIPGGATIVGMVANMRRVKGADVLIRAMEYLPANIHAVLIGEVRDPQIPRLVTDLGLEKRVHFTGYRHDAPYLLPAFHINVAPSRGREGLTRTVIEGMAQGIPAVATTAGGLPELVADGETGFIVSPDDPVQLASRLCYLAEHPTVHQKMARASKERIASRFHVSQTVSLTAACYRTVLEAR